MQSSGGKESQQIRKSDTDEDVQAEVLFNFIFSTNSKLLMKIGGVSCEARWQRGVGEAADRQIAGVTRKVVF